MTPPTEQEIEAARKCAEQLHNCTSPGNCTLTTAQAEVILSTITSQTQPLRDELDLLGYWHDLLDDTFAQTEIAKLRDRVKDLEATLNRIAFDKSVSEVQSNPSLNPSQIAIEALNLAGESRTEYDQEMARLKQQLAKTEAALKLHWKAPNGWSWSEWMSYQYPTCKGDISLHDFLRAFDKALQSPTTTEKLNE